MSTTRAPRIGITLEYEHDPLFGLVAELCNDYASALWQAGGVPWPIPYSAEKRDMEAILSQVDGLILTGGQDIDPELYGEPVTGSRGINRMIDEHELSILRIALQKKLPILGVCRGMQLLNVHSGGTLQQDIRKHRQRDPATIRHPAHDVRLAGRLAEVFGAELVGVNTYHHQAIKTLAPSLEACAWHEKGVIEGITIPGQPILGIQWHPEMMFADHPEHLKLFRWLVEEAKKRKNALRVNGNHPTLPS